MPGNSILELPSEIRLQIYTYAFSSPTGYLCALPRHENYERFTLAPFEPPNCIRGGLIALPLLQTCRLINSEARDVVYEHNTWAIPYIGDLLWKFRELDAGLSHRVRHIWLKVDFTHRPGLRDTAKSLDVLSRWVQQAGNLQTVTLNAVAGTEEMMEVIDLRTFGEPLYSAMGRFNPRAGEKLFDEYLRVLRDSWAEDHSRWAGVKRKLELRVEYVRQGYIGDPREMVKEMHDAFKGELWIDGKLCYKDGEEVLQPFEWDRSAGILQIAWFRNHSRFWSQ